MNVVQVGLGILAEGVRESKKKKKINPYHKGKAEASTMRSYALCNYW